MQNQEEYHDPDYAVTSVVIKKESSNPTEEEKKEKISSIISREFTKELEAREDEVNTINQKLSTSRRLLHRIRYRLVNNYYNEQKLLLSNSQIQDEISFQSEPRAREDVATILRDRQRRLHPSVRKLLGKGQVDLDEVLLSRGPRNKSRKDYCAMVQTRNYTIPADSTKSLRPGATKVEVFTEPSTSKPKKVPRHIEPKIKNVMTLEEVTRNKKKYRYRIIIGNTSKYAPAASQADKSTHKWLLYVRGASVGTSGTTEKGGGGDVSKIISAVTVTLHHTYAPHLRVHISKPPFHVSRRGWGEFPAKVELHFPLPERNRPVTVEHTIKLDRNYTGLQTLGAETVIDVWLYSTDEMIKHEYKGDIEINLPIDVKLETNVNVKKEIPIKEEFTEPMEISSNGQDNWLDFFSKETALNVDDMLIKNVRQETDIEELIDSTKIDVKEKSNKVNLDLNSIVNPADNIPDEILKKPTSPKKRIMKYMDPTTGKIFYLEMDRTLDLSKVQEIVINSNKGDTKIAKISPIRSNGLKNVRKTKKGVSLLKPEVTSLLNSKEKPKINNIHSHIENDHCYLAKSPVKQVLPVKEVKEIKEVSVAKVNCEKNLFDSLCEVLPRFSCVKVAVNYLLKRIPLVSDDVRDPEFVKRFPFVVENFDKYWRLDFAKRRNIEWSRAKLIQTLLSKHLPQQKWRTKQILIYSRLHGFYPVRSELKRISETEEHYDNSRTFETNIKELYPKESDLNTLSKFTSDDYETYDTVEIGSDEEVDIVECCHSVVKKESVLPDAGRLVVLPVEDDEERLRFLFLERKCADVGIELRNEDVGSGFSYSAVHAVMLSAMKSFAEELIRSGLANNLSGGGERVCNVWKGSSSSRPHLSLEHIYGGIRSNSRLHALTSNCIGTEKKQTCNL